MTMWSVIQPSNIVGFVPSSTGLRCGLGGISARIGFEGVETSMDLPWNAPQKKRRGCHDEYDLLGGLEHVFVFS